MPWLVGSLLSGLAALFRSRIGEWFAAALLFFGLSWATHKFVVDPWLDQLQTGVDGVGGGDLGAAAAAWFGVLQFDVACTMIASAVVAKYTSDAAKAFLVKKP